MREFILQCTAFEIAAVGVMFFGGIYLLFGSLNVLLTQHLLPALNIGGTLDPRPLGEGQHKRELLLSAGSIAIFGVGMIFPWGLLQLGWAHLAINPSGLQIGVEILTLVIWNEIHFYANHWLLHTPWLRRFHMPHHRSVVTSPWSTYAFHPVEAMMLGNVILLPMLAHDFSIYALFSVPLFSLLFNSIGHANYDWKKTGMSAWHTASRRHHLHHACFSGNFGFMFPFMDQLCKTTLPLDAADKQIKRWREREQ